MMGPQHLVNVTAYDFDIQRLGGVEGIQGLIAGQELDGVEMLTGHFPSPRGLNPLVKGVHLPYAVDWYSGWMGEHELDGMEEEQVRFLCFGRDRDAMVRTLTSMIRHASPLEPTYGVLHGGSPNINRVFSQDNGRSDHEVLEALAELLNSAIAELPGGEPPFTIALENLWWPGLRLMAPWELHLLDRRLEFDDWGVCLDTGHLMNTLRDCRQEADAVESLLRVLDGLGGDVMDRICAMHLHMSLSADYQLETMAVGESQEYREADLDRKLEMAYPHFGRMDWHSPFTIDACAQLVETVAPGFVTHEFIAPQLKDLDLKLSKQLSHFR